ncbi:MAG: hypothetical protein ABWZ25_06250 [Chitinophagaceae bacterium]
MLIRSLNKKFLTACLTCCIGFNAMGQTDIDAIMMEKNAFCVGPMYTHSSWKEYWEGTLKRENLNLGRVTTQMYGLMGSYGITRKLNALFSVPYVRTKASAGTLHPMDGIQDLSLFLKYRAMQYKLGNGKISVFAIGGVTFPLTDYPADFLPLSIGLQSKAAIARGMVDYQLGNLFATVSGSYIFRDDIKIDRTSYYTTEMHYTNKVKMYDMTNVNVRLGFRNQQLIAEAILNQSNSLGGFDITRNNMPFPSNKMNSTMVGVNIKYVIPKIPQLSVVAGGMHTVAGRNVGKATSVYGSFFYVFDFSPRSKTIAQTNNSN